MANHAFIKPLNGSYRMRFVIPGQNANDLTLPANQVVLDSEMLSTLPIYVAGEVSLNISTSSLTKEISWPSLGYVPFAVFSFRENNAGESSTNTWRPGLRVSRYNERTSLFVRADGLYTTHQSGTGDDYSSDKFCRYVVFRKPAFG